MKEAEVKARAFAMPLTSPAYPPGSTLGLGKVAYDYLGSPAKRESAPKPATAGVA
jgi:acetoacetate decarboxylase